MLAVVNCCEQRRIRAVNKDEPVLTGAKSLRTTANNREQPANNLQATANKRSANKVTKVYTKFFCSYLMTSIRKMSYVW